MRTSLITLVAATSLLALPGAATAATASATAAPAGDAPSCVTVWQRTGTVTKTGYARNDCGYTMNLKIVWAHGVDGSCQTARPGATISSKVPRGPRNFDGAGRC